MLLQLLTGKSTWFYNQWNGTCKCPHCGDGTKDYTEHTLNRCKNTNEETLACLETASKREIEKDELLENNYSETLSLAYNLTE